MSKKYKNKYRIDSIRLQSWDYRWDGAYFVTICTYNREHYFGEIKQGIMGLSAIGELADKYWQEIPAHFPFIKLDEYVIMPDHIHGIVVIDKASGNLRKELHVESLHATTPHVPAMKNIKMSTISPKPGSLSTIIRSYKSVVTKYAHHINPDFTWQSRFYEHIVRNDKSFRKIASYIRKNPANW